MHPVITPRELAELLATPEPPTVLDVRWSLAGPPGSTDYRAGHLPGAAFLDLDAELAGPPGAGGRHPLPDPDALQAALRRAGVRDDVPVVAYDAADGSVAARAWWLLHWAGHRQVAVLDGGIAAWRAEGRPETTEVPPPAPGAITVRPGAMPVLDAAGAAALARTGRLLDARAPERYRGDTEPVDPRAGHVPGARNAPFAALTDDSGRWLTPEALRDVAGRWGLDVTEGTTDGSTGAAAHGAGAPPPVGAYCGSGVTACAVVLGLERAGVTTAERPAALYAGSWSQWCTDPGRPVATGPDPG